MSDAEKDTAVLMLAEIVLWYKRESPNSFFGRLMRAKRYLYNKAPELVTSSAPPEGKAPANGGAKKSKKKRASGGK